MRWDSSRAPDRNYPGRVLAFVPIPGHAGNVVPAGLSIERLDGMAPADETYAFRCHHTDTRFGGG